MTNCRQCEFEKVNWYRRGLDVALGKDYADLVVRDCTVLNVYTGTLLPHRQVGVAGPFIAYVTSRQLPTGPDTIILEGKGKCLIPGFIDVHAHLDVGHLTVPEFLRHGIAGGTTTFVTNSMDVGNSMGYAGLLRFLESCSQQPVHVFVTLPTMVPGDPTLLIGHHLDANQLAELLSRPEVLGLGESYWTRIIRDQDSLLPVFSLAERMSKVIEGHGTGARELNLGAFAASGVTSCHEAITVEEVDQRLDLGIFTILREGSIRRDLGIMAPLAGRDMDFRHLGLCTDGLDPPELLRFGAMEHVVQRAIEVGFEPVTAIQMATINNACQLHLDRLLGSVTPGRFADFLLVGDLEAIKAEAVVAKGRLVAQNGRLLALPRPYRFPPEVSGILRFSRRFSPEELSLRPPPGQQRARVRVIDQRNDMVTGATEAELEVRGGGLELQPGLNKAIAVSTLNPEAYTLAAVSGWGLSEGACASSATWNAPYIIGVGASDEELACAVNRVAELGGGIAVCRGKTVVAELPLTIGGSISDLPAENVAARMEQATSVIKEMGYPHSNPLLALRALGCVGIPRLRLSGRGLLLVGSGSAELVDLLL